MTVNAVSKVELVVQLIGLSGIAVPPNRLRALREETVKTLAQSMKDQGLIHPIVVRPRPDTGY